MTGNRKSISAINRMREQLMASGYAQDEARNFAFTYHGDRRKCRPRVQAWKNFCQTANVIRYERSAFRQAEGLCATALRAWKEGSPR